MGIRATATVIAVVGLIAASAPSEAPAQQTVTAKCDTPPSSRDGCNRWYTEGSVTLGWDWSAGGSIVSGCQSDTFASEARFERACTVRWIDGSLGHKPVWIGIDRTPPEVGMATSRPPDYNGWYNHPLDIAFTGRDATSGVAGCSSTSYGGPDGAGIPLGGTCRDVAGNTGSGSGAINYDATPPAPPGVGGRPANRGAQVTWRTAPDVTGVTIVRSRKGAGPSVVFSGGGGSFRDRKLRNGVRYRYDVVAVDQAGNRSQSSVSLVPTASRLLNPASGARLRTPPRLIWKGVRRARYYNVQLYQGRRKVLTAWPRGTQFKLKSAWRFRGKRMRLRPGRYRWFVWPGYGRVSAGRYGRLLGGSTFTIVR